MSTTPPPDGRAVPGALDPKAELSEFLRLRRAGLKPQDVGLPELGRQRRVPGLRREELAQLAGVSVAYYTRLEQGNAGNVSAEVLDAVARALRLSDAEHEHLLHLARARPGRKKKRGCPTTLRPALGTLLDSLDVPAYVLDGRTDILGWNRLAAALLHDFGTLPPHRRNFARLVFLEPALRDRFVDWEAKAAETVRALRVYAGYCSEDTELTGLIGELSLHSEDFRRLWAAHEVRDLGHGTKVFRHPLVGELTLSYETLRLPDDPGQSLFVYHAEPGSPSAEALRLLGSWGKDAAAVVRG
ncbi:helix-turn-helix transcriptional regulator [Streptomyces sp. DSM 41982]|uniref:Helix-turn-helix transcriptional regulator n=1 Tax=Streptomyces evansiae TaxID=3075535 RepID=A0ABD5DYM6_9ACTN|nr:helix-turn-helix transcriptional regulator [Streptomyces sp. DSM 41982]MDT0414258.1 helix-turn-helix transcriptional regulator [Streptomyces sp. DSM 41982]